jgi:adenosylmethionine-8-amino-7-oxononanoate aminotransferase
MNREELTKGSTEQVWLNFASGEELRRREPKVITEGKGATFTDADGHEVIDGFAAMQSCQVGHGREEIARAVYEQMLRLEFAPAVIDFFTVPLIELANKLTEIMPKSLSRTYFTNDGSEAVEVALKIAKQYWWEKGYRKRYKIISRRWAYHGVTMGALSCTGHPYFRPALEPMVPGVTHVPPPYCYRCDYGLSYPGCDVFCAKAIDQAITWENPESVAAVIAEPLMGAALGYADPPAAYWPAVQEICRRQGVLLIVDEVLDGFCRTGKWFACQHWDVEPDIMTMAKGITSGYLPLGATATRAEIADVFCGDQATSDLRHGHTYGGHTTACAAAVANLRIMERENLVERAQTMGAYIREQIRALFDKHPTMGDLRGLGMLYGIELVADRQSKGHLPRDKAVGNWIRRRAWDLGLIIRADADILLLAPPLTITKDEADRMVAIVDQAIGEAEQQLSLI